MSTPQEKAKELVDKMYATQGAEDGITYYEAIDCALIAVDEIILSKPFKAIGLDGDEYYSVYDSLIYWQQVKEEIEKL